MPSQKCFARHLAWWILPSATRLCYTLGNCLSTWQTIPVLAGISVNHNTMVTCAELFTEYSSNYMAHPKCFFFLLLKLKNTAKWPRTRSQTCFGLESQTVEVAHEYMALHLVRVCRSKLFLFPRVTVHSKIFYFILCNQKTMSWGTGINIKSNMDFCCKQTERMREKQVKLWNIILILPIGLVKYYWFKIKWFAQQKGSGVLTEELNWAFYWSPKILEKQTLICVETAEHNLPLKSTHKLYLVGATSYPALSLCTQQLTFCTSWAWSGDHFSPIHSAHCNPASIYVYHNVSYRWGTTYNEKLHRDIWSGTGLKYWH